MNLPRWAISLRKSPIIRSTELYCYKRTTSDGLTYYEVFKAPKRVCKDGGKHECYPQTAEFGFGTALCIRGGEKYTADKIAFYMANGFEAGRFRA